MRAIAASLVVLGLISACGSSDSTPGGSGAAEPFTPAPKRKLGAVNLFIGDSPTSGPGSGKKAFSIAGYFLDYSGAPPESVPGGYSFGGTRASDCTRRKAGDCELVKCKLTKDPSFQFAQAKYTTAGEITAKLSTGSELKASASADTSNSYLGEVPLTDVPGAGTTVTVNAAGADVPAFTETLTFADPLVLKSSPQVNVAKGTDVKVEWTGGQGIVLLQASDGSMDSPDIVSLTCKFSSSGAGTIPGAVLADEVVGRKLGVGLSLVQVQKTVGDYEVEMVAQISNDGIAGANFDLQVE